MPGIFGDIQRQLNDFWQSLENNQKIKIISISAIVVLIISVGIYLLSRPSFEVLYNNLSSKDMYDATTKLSESKIQYKISDDGYSILVPNTDKNKARMILAQANIPKTNATYADAAPSSTSFGTTQSDKDRQFIEYKAVDVANALKANSNAISDAQVFYNIADNNNFFGDQQKSTASVKITPTGQLSPSQIDGIARFVANSVQGLDPKDVEVVDNNNNSLKDNNNEAIAGSDTQYNLTQTKKKKLETDIKGLLGNISDFDEVNVAANLVLDFNSEAVDATEYQPVTQDGTGLVVSESSSTEQLNNGSTGGAPGTDSNSGTSTYTTTNTNSQSGSSYSKNDSVKNYVTNEKIIQTKKALGQIDTNNSSIAVTLFYGNNSKTKPGQAVIDQVKNIVSMASGLSPDKISVESFKTITKVAAQPTFNFADALDKYGVIVLSLILIGLLGYAVFTGSAKRIKGFDESIAINRIKKQPEVPIEEIEMEEKSEVKKQIDKFIKQKPDAVASLLRNWLTDDF